MFFVVLALSHLALTEPRRPIVFVCGVTAVAVPAIVAAFRGTDWGWQYWMMGFAFGWGFGELGYRFRLARDELASARAVIADQAALDERQRIARDVHDVLGHSLTIVMLQLTAARHLLRRDPDEADAALADAERVGRDSLNQVRRTVGMLRVGTEDRDGSTDDRGGPVAHARGSRPAPRRLPLGRHLRSRRGRRADRIARRVALDGRLPDRPGGDGERLEALTVGRHGGDDQRRRCRSARAGSSSTTRAAASTRTGHPVASGWSECGSEPDRSVAPCTPARSATGGGCRPNCHR